jgi:hypothetical protein
VWSDFAILAVYLQEMNIKAAEEYKIAENDWRVTLVQNTVLVSTVGGPARGQIL